MSSPSSDRHVSASLSPQAIGISWLPVAFGLLVLYLPVFIDFGRTIWLTEEQGHVPIILAVSAWFFWQKRHELFSAGASPGTISGWASLILGLLLYVVGCSQNVVMFETSSLIFVLAGVLLLKLGINGLRTFWFPLAYLVFIIPLPGFLLELLTAPLKLLNSRIVETLLYQAGYPIARDGVTLSIGQYQLLVSDACAGLHSMFSLSALGLLYMYIASRKSLLHNGLMLASILPVAMIANIVRIMVLVLVTYYLGDEAGQSFMHGLSGIVLLLVALSSLFVLDSWLANLIRR